MDEIWNVEAAGQSFIYRDLVIIAMEVSENNDQAKIQSARMGKGSGALLASALDGLAEAKQRESHRLARTDISKQKSQQEVIMEGHLSALRPPTKQPLEDLPPKPADLLANPAPAPSQAEGKSPIDGDESENKKSRELSQINEEVKTDNALVTNRKQRQKKSQALLKLKDFEQKLRDSGQDVQGTYIRQKPIRQDQYVRAELNRIFKKPQTSPSTPISYPEMTLHVDMNEFSFTHFASEFGLFDIVVIDEQVSTVFDLNPHRLIKDGLLFVWADRHQVHLGYYLMGRWGFDVIDQIVWVKTIAEEDKLAVDVEGKGNLNNGNAVLNTNCMCLVGFRNTSGKCFEYKTKVSNNLIFSDKDGGRPGQIYEIAELMMPGSKKIDLYNKRELKGWVCLQHVPQKSPAVTQQIEKKIYYQQFDYKCQMCGIMRIHHCCFQCQTCKTYLCQHCMFKLDKQIKSSQEDPQKSPKPWHPPLHQWRIQVTNKLNYYDKDNTCLYCTKKLKLLKKNYVCENCIGVFVCEECHGKDLDRKGNHAHRKGHNLTLLV